VQWKEKKQMADEMDVFDEAMDEDSKEPADLDVESGSNSKQSDEEESRAAEQHKGNKEQDEEDPEDPVATLRSQVESLNKEKSGLYREMMTERTQRQALAGKMDAINQTLQAIREQRGGSQGQGQEYEQTDLPSGVEVKFNENGDPYVDPKDLEGLTSKQFDDFKQDLVKELNHVRGQNAVNQANTQNQRIISSVMQQDSRYPEAVKTLNKAYSYLDSKAAEVMTKNNLTMETATVEQVIDLLEQEIGDEFSSKYPGLDIDTTVEARTAGQNGLYNRRKITRALKSIVKTAPSSEQKENQDKAKLDNLKRLNSKPSNLSGQRNQKGAAGRTLNDIAETDFEDFVNMSDADIAKIERAIAGSGG